ncbi:hypothetical protein FOZ60_015305 [Perkinsus olseni]|uniref:SWIM-type domain-containing protein n=2 Tax=Perkinsus olseni TaxID=32597 RepID=A0A7J6N619_PEROL|nr:hypothetical protein FOZ60_015305 [Perkinsus olseni]
MAIINEECYDVYYHLLVHLDTLVKALTLGESTLQSVVNLCVHDAHQGALKACREVLPNVRNARCYFHLTKNLKDNKSTLGEGFNILKRHKYWLHASPTDALNELVSDTMVDAVTGVSPRGGEYLRRTLDTEQYGYPNIAVTNEGVVGNQVVTSLKLSSPQHYVKRPETINAVEYKNDMKLRGTKFYQRGCVAEVTAMIPDMVENNVGTRYFLLPNNRSPGQQTDAEMRETIQVFLRGILLDELDGDDDLTLAEVMSLYFCYYLVTVSPQQQQTGFGRQRIPPSCTCKEYRDWGCCGHGYAVETYLESRPPSIPENRRMAGLRRGRATARNRGVLGRYNSAVSIPQDDGDLTDNSVNNAGNLSDGESSTTINLSQVLVQHWLPS